MRRFLMTALLVGSMGAVPMITGCDRTLHENEKTTTGPNGQQTTEQQKTVQHPDGSVTTEKQVQHNGPANP